MDKLNTCAFLPAPCDPFVLLHCLHYFYEVWQDEVDTLYICLNSDIEYNVIADLIQLLNHPKIVLTYFNRTLGHGTAINEMLSLCNEDYILLIEDDSIIFKKGVVTKYFELLKNNTYDLVGSPRMSCPPAVAEYLKKEFDLNYEGWGDKGPNFWPCFLWARKQDLLNTDRNFSATEFGDTFVNTSIQLRKKGLKILEIPQYHLSPDDEINLANNRGVFDGECGYMHFGSLSSGIENTLLDQNNKPLKDRKKPNCGEVNLKKRDLTPMEKLELERRVVWWNEAYRLNQQLFGEFGDAYGKAIEKLIIECKLSRENINNMLKMYKEVIQC